MGEIKVGPEGQEMLQMLVLFYYFLFAGGRWAGVRKTIRSPRKCLTKWRTLVWARCGCRMRRGASRRQIQRVGAGQPESGFPILLEQGSANFVKGHSCDRLKKWLPKDIHILIPETYKCYLNWKKDLCRCD